MKYLSFNHGMHARMLKESSELARQYRIDCGLEKIQNTEPEKRTEIAIQEEIVNSGDNTPKTLENITEAKQIEGNISECENIEFTRENLIEKLKSANIHYNWNCKDETLLKLCIENNLI